MLIKKNMYMSNWIKTSTAESGIVFKGQNNDCHCRGNRARHIHQTGRDIRAKYYDKVLVVRGAIYQDK